MRRGEIKPMPAEDEAALYSWTLEAPAGFTICAVRNFQLREVASRESLHNLLYWQSSNWLGIGPKCTFSARSATLGQRQ